MLLERPAREDPGVLRLSRGETLGVLERVGLLVVLTGVIAVDLFGLFFSASDVAATVLSIVMTAAFALFLWSPLAATAAITLILVLAFAFGHETGVLAAASFAVGLVVRLGWTALLLSYLGVFLVAVAVLAYTVQNAPVNVGIYLIAATLAGAVGLGLRAASARGRRLEQELVDREQREREAVLAERRWIAGELHDSIAHHLTIVSLHVQMLDDDRARSESQEAIRVAARKAMADLRFVIELADDGPRAPGMQTGDLEAAVSEARAELEAAGHDVVCDGDLSDERLTRTGEIIFARVVRESVTNILKHAGPGTVAIRLLFADDSAWLTIESPLPATPRRDLPSSRTGLGRMAERVLSASGDFHAGEEDSRWRVSARLPVA